MEQGRHIRHYHRHFGFSYPVSIRQRLYSFVVIPLFVLLAILLIQTQFSSFSYIPVPHSVVYHIVGALGATFVRIVVAYIIALACSIPLALLITHNALAERVLLPTFDIIQSVPALAFFPIIVTAFLHYNFINGAAIFILFLAMVWNIVFSVVGGIRVVPNDIKAAAQVFHITGFSYIYKVLLPSVVPYIITGSLLAWAQAWNIVIVAEVLHTYIPGGDPSKDLFGIGAVLVNASAHGQQQIFLIAIACMIIVIGLLNFFVWQKLLRYAEHYKFE